MVDLVVKKSKPAEVYFPSKVVFPKTGEFTLRCSNCNSYNFKIHVLPKPQVGGAKITELVCTVCLKWCALDDSAMLQAAGKARPKKRSKNNGSHSTKI